MTLEQETKAQQIADLMTELGASIWKGVVHLDAAPYGKRIILTEDYSWKYTEGKAK